MDAAYSLHSLQHTYDQTTPIGISQTGSSQVCKQSFLAQLHNFIRSDNLLICYC